MTVTKSLLALALALLVCASCAPAQMPTDNDAWSARCEALHAALPSLQRTAPGWLTAAPKPIPGPQWTEFGWDRERAVQPAVACVFFYLGAVADHDAPLNHADRVHDKESWTMGLIAWKSLHHRAPTALERLTRDHAKLAEIPKHPLTVAEEQIMLNRSRTLPLGPPRR